MLAIVDYGVGNLFSLRCSLNSLGVEAALTSSAEVLRSADRIILPGVGAFGDASKKLRETGLFDELRFSASASECSFCLKKALNSASMRASGS